MLIRLFAVLLWTESVKRRTDGRKRRLSELSVLLSSEALDLKPTLLYLKQILKLSTTVHTSAIKPGLEKSTGSLEDFLGF